MIVESSTARIAGGFFAGNVTFERTNLTVAWVISAETDPETYPKLQVCLGATGSARGLGCKGMLELKLVLPYTSVLTFSLAAFVGTEVRGFGSCAADRCFLHVSGSSKTSSNSVSRSATPMRRRMLVASLQRVRLGETAVLHNVIMS